MMSTTSSPGKAGALFTSRNVRHDQPVRYARLEMFEYAGLSSRHADRHRLAVYQSFAVKLSWRRPIVSISAAKSSSCPREHPRTAHGIHAANVGLCESPIQKVAWGDERRAVSGNVSDELWNQSC